MQVDLDGLSPILIFQQHAVDSEMGQRVAAQMNAEYWECSSKNSMSHFFYCHYLLHLLDTNVQELFSRIAVGLFECAVQRQIKEADSYHSKPQVAHTLEFSERGASINSNTTGTYSPQLYY